MCVCTYTHTSRARYRHLCVTSFGAGNVTTENERPDPRPRLLFEVILRIRPEPAQDIRDTLADSSEGAAAVVDRQRAGLTPRGHLVGQVIVWAIKVSSMMVKFCVTDGAAL